MNLTRTKGIDGESGDSMSPDWSLFLDFCTHGSGLLEVILEGSGSAFAVSPSAPTAVLVHLYDLLYLSMCADLPFGQSSILLMLYLRTLEAF